ncbi:MAG: hypothetical protein ACLFV3_09255 [Phycisphaeraceae bacterium]
MQIKIDIADHLALEISERTGCDEHEMRMAVRCAVQCELISGPTELRWFIEEMASRWANQRLTAQAAGSPGERLGSQVVRTWDGHLIHVRDAGLDCGPKPVTPGPRAA